MPDAPRPLLTRIVELFLRADVTLSLIGLSLVLGVMALLLTPREEEPQIVVPLADVFVSAPGLSATEVEQQVTTRLEKLLYQIDGVEYVYSMSRPEHSIVTVRFYVGEDREDSLVKLYNKLNSNLDQVPPQVAHWVVKPVEVDDVPVVNVTLWSSQPERYGDHELRRIAEELQNEMQAVPDTNQVTVLGGRPRRIRVELDPSLLAARGVSALQVAEAIQQSNVNVRAGTFEQQNREFVVEAGTFAVDLAQLRRLVVRVADGRPVYLQDVAQLIDGPAEVERYSWLGFGPAATHSADTLPAGTLFPAVHVAVAKRKGTNAVTLARNVERKLDALAPTLFPRGVHARITRNYGESADEKVNELIESLAVAVLTVIGLIGMALGWRAALVVALAIPVCYSLTLFCNWLAGYTINRVTLFALILSLGILVDDPITDVENIVRYFALRTLPKREAVLQAVQEVRLALILATLAVIISFLPLVYITGLMGPYMRPMALNVPLTMLASMLVAFLITPWLSLVALPAGAHSADDHAADPRSQRLYRWFYALLAPILDRRWLSYAVLGGVALVFGLSLLLPVFRLVPLKMLPYDNKNEFQLIVDLPEGSTLETTDAACRELARHLATVNEVEDFQVYVGFASAMDFNGLVRHYFLRRGAHVADLRVNLVSKDLRQQQSHEIALRLRDSLVQCGAKFGAQVKLVEVPPGPPVIATITAEVYAPASARYNEMIQVARGVADRLRREPGVVDVDTSAEDDQVRFRFETDKPKAALSGVSTQEVARTLQWSLAGLPASVMHLPHEVDPLSIELRLARPQRSGVDALSQLYVRGQDGALVPLGAIGRFVQQTDDKTIYHKNLKRVSYVFAEVAGRPPADAILDVEFDRQNETPVTPPPSAPPTPRPVERRTWLAAGGGDPWQIPPGFRVVWSGEGEWKITLDVFRDLGIAFAAALACIFALLMFQTGSRSLPLVIMLAIPLTLIGILPGFWLLNALGERHVAGYPNPVFFTATAMIGMIALAGIVVRNSVLLIEFIHHALAQGVPLREAIIQSAAVRTRPILLTAGTTLLGNWVITLDPIFSGLAWSVMFGIFASTLFTLIVVPVVYWLVYQRTAGHPAG